MKLSRFGYLTLCVLPLSFAFDGRAQSLVEVRFSDLFAGALLGDDLVIQVPDDKILVIDDRRSPYQIEHKNIFVRAKRARVEGKPIVRSFSITNTAAATEGTPATPQTAPPGQKGAPGAGGKPGMSAGHALVDIEQLDDSPGASLAVEMRGQTGGKGQKGGQGGRGGPGAAGRGARSDFPSCSRPCPDGGGRGGEGGQRGAGGTGGPGGAGGTVFLSPSLSALVSAKSPVLAITVKGGAPGQSGDVGERGLGGPGGPRGSGGNCECKNVPPPGPDGALGADTPDATAPGSSGADGSLQRL